ncbi:MAG: 16S rRNA (guanine(966)-N(2))-methyltransferase RsmD [Bacteroidaceae bacterium]|nr:16S rRNA (guanine(966)-N(2))-methyltransferase RsmD [Bacteroidaceae bacterium]
MRVISGIYRHRRFEVPRTFKARPTTDFAKESLFNVLANRIDLEDASALDLFSGTGSISIELVSRGCSHVVSVENDPDHYRFICKVMETVKTDRCLPVKGDVFKYIAGCNTKFDFIFADPPYQLENLADIPDLVFDAGILADDGIFVLEHGKTNNFSNHPHFTDMKVYGSVHFSFFK